MSSPLSYVRVDRDMHGNVDLVQLLDAADLPGRDELSSYPMTTTVWEVSSHSDGAAQLVFDPARSWASRDADSDAFDTGDENLLDFYNTTEYVQLRLIESEFIRNRVLHAHVGPVLPGVMGIVVQDDTDSMHGFYVVGHTGHTWYHRTPKGDIHVVVDSEAETFENADLRTLVGKFCRALGF